MDDLPSIAVSNAVAATILAAIALAVGAVYRRPAVVHGLWLLVLLKLVTPPLVHIPVAWPTATEPARLDLALVAEEPPAATVPRPEEEPAAVVVLAPAAENVPPANEPAATVDLPTVPSSPPSPDPPLWPQLLWIVWGVGSLAWFLLALERLHRFRRLLRFAQSAPAPLQERARGLARSLGLSRCPRVRLLPGRIAPMLWAVGGPPRLLVPVDLLGLLSDEQLDTLLVHELAHLRRHDHWVRVLEFVVMGLYWWHPVVWYARRELHEAEEQCCDAWVVSTLPGAGRTYASALLDTLDFLSTAQPAVPPLASGLGQVADLKRRLTMIMRGTTPRALSWPGCLAVVVLGLTFLPMLPALHGQPPSKEEDTAKTEVEEAKARLAAAEAKVEAVKQKNIVQLMKQYNELLKEGKYAEAVNIAVRLQELDPENPMIAAAINQAIMLRRASSSKELMKALTISSPGRVEKKATYRIEITVPVEASMNDNEILERIKKALPEKLRREIVIRRVLVPENSLVTKPPQSESEKRINDLEKKLEKVLHELHELRKQMKEPRSGSSGTKPSSPTTTTPRAHPPIAPQPPGSEPPPPVEGERLPPSRNAPGYPQSPPPSGGAAPPLNNPYYAPTIPLKPHKLMQR